MLALTFIGLEHFSWQPSRGAGPSWRELYGMRWRRPRHGGRDNFGAHLRIQEGSPEGRAGQYVRGARRRDGTGVLDGAGWRLW